MSKDYTVNEDAPARDWLACYGYLVKSDPRWLAGMPDVERLYRRATQQQRQPVVMAVGNTTNYAVRLEAAA